MPISPELQAKIDAKLQEAGLVQKKEEPKSVKEEQKESPPILSPKGKRVIAIEDPEIGDTYEIEMDEDDPASAFRDYVLKAKKAEFTESELKATKDEYSSRKQALEAKEKELNKLFAAASSDQEFQNVLKILKEKGSIEDYKRAIIEEHNKYMSMSKEERESFDRDREKAALLKREKKLQDDLEAKIKEQDNREKALRRQEKLVMYQRGFKSNSFENSSNDPAIERLNRTIFNQASESLANLEKEGVILTDAIIAREFKKEYNLLAKSVKPGSKSKTEEIREKIDAMDASAADAIAKSPGKKTGSPTESDVLARWKEMVSKGQGAAVVKEAQTSPQLMELYVREGRSLISKNLFKPAGNNSHLKWK